ncbi:MAG TPA: SsgA family sporulation/cell division regulator [Nocardioidaceae bacterium]|nr:SsgA family sporulation/cell division regulator [Nocardioidaceae bacterium]
MMEHPLNMAPATVTQLLGLELIDGAGSATPIEAELHYDPSDPYAVTAVFLTGDSPVRWTFGRDLLLEGIAEPAGDGDVHVWPCMDADGRPVVLMELCSPDGEALIQARTEQLAAFLDRVTAAVPPGSEPRLLDIDSALAAIFAAESA